MRNGRSVAADERPPSPPPYISNGLADSEPRLGHENEAFIESDQVNGLENEAPLMRLSTHSELMRNPQRLAVNVNRVRVISGNGSRASEILKSIDLTLPRGKM